MSDFESFSPSESSEGADAGAIERMREQMKAGAQAMKKDQQQEQKQKKSEDAMYQILVVFLDKLGPTHPLVFYVVKTLKDNFLSEVIITIISLTHPILQPQVGLELVTAEQEISIQNEKALIVPELSVTQTPLNLRFNIEIWIKLINQKVFLEPVRNLKALKSTKDPLIPKHSFTDLMSYVAQDYLQQSNVDFNGAAIEKFIRALITNLIERLEAHIQSTPKINTPDDNTQN